MTRIRVDRQALRSTRAASLTTQQRFLALAEIYFEACSTKEEHDHAPPRPDHGANGSGRPEATRH